MMTNGNFVHAPWVLQSLLSPLQVLFGPFLQCLRNGGSIGDAATAATSAHGSGGFASCNMEFDALIPSLFICLCFIIYSFTWSIIGQNCSKVDQIWSITPVVYAWHFYFHDMKLHDK
jgi:hypothetical protein